MSRSIICLIIFFLSTIVLKANTSNTNLTLKQNIEKMARTSGIQINDLGISLTKMGTEIIDINASKKFIPASITKLFTSLAVLENILPGTRFSTKLESIASREGSILKGDLYLIGGGDSGFVSESMWYLVNAFTRERIKTIEGDIVVDDSLFDDKRFDESREDHRVDRAYDAPVGAMSFNWNSVNIFLRPSEKSGEPGFAFIDPENDYIKIDSKLKTSNSSSFNVDRKNLSDSRDAILITGKIAQNELEQVVYKGITNPALWAGENLKRFLKERGISVQGKIRIGKSPSGTKILAENLSKPIEHLLADMNKFSSNYVAEMLTKQIAVTTGSLGTLSAGLNIIRESVKKAGVSSEEFEIENPSGLTRKNLFTPRSLTKVLERVRKDFRLFPEFSSSLPIAGVDGTLKKRMKGAQTLRWVRAKTGLLTGVASLAGFIGNESGDILCFSFIYNGSKDGAAVRNFYDRIISELILAQKESDT